MNESLNKWLAEKVMGWTMPSGDFWWDEQGAVASETGWNPPNNIEQAMMCLVTFDWYSICKNDDAYARGKEIYSCEVTGSNQVHVSSSQSMAISLACGKASGWEE